MHSKCPHAEGKIPTEQTSSFALLLKHGTQDLHDQAESADFQRRMVDGSLLRDEYGAFLSQVRHVHSAVEPVMRAAIARDGRVAAMVREEHFRLAKIDRDLADLGVESPAAPLPATERFAAFVHETAERDPVSLIGILYVKEGATNGNKIVAKRIRESLGLGEDVAMGYLDPHGADQRRRWNAFKSALDAITLNADERARCLEAARATFRLFMELSTEINRSAVSGPAV